MDRQFEIGDEVTWKSQAAGRLKDKHGVVVRVLEEYEAFSHFDIAHFKNLFRGYGVGSPRKGRSYVVDVDGKFYWPRANALRLIEPADIAGGAA